MKRIFALALIIASSLFAAQPSMASQVSGTVSTIRSGCDYFLVKTKLGYDLLEWYGGHTPDNGDLLIGSFEDYGFHSIYDKTANATTRIYVEEYWLDEDDASDKLNEHC